MRGTVSRLSPLVLLCALSLTRCDSFSLLEQFTLPDDRLTLAVDRTTVERLIGTVGLTPSGGTKPYAFAADGYELYTETGSQSKGSFSGLSYIAGGAIGKIRITVTDSAGSSAIAYMTVLPTMPDLTGTASADGSTINLYWSDPDIPSTAEYRLECSTDGQAYAVIEYPQLGEEHYLVNNLVWTNTLNYRLYAIAGNYESSPATKSFTATP